MDAHGTRQHHILLVEDDDGARLSLSRVLDRAGYRVTAVPDGEQACELMSAGETFDVVLTDLLLREIDGVGVLKAAKALPDPPEVILLTGYGTLQTALEALRAGVFDYLLKPTRPDDLLNYVERAVRQRHERVIHATAVRAIARGLAQLQGEGKSTGAAQNLEPGGDERQRIVVGELSIDRASHSVSFAGGPLSLTPTEYELLVCLAEARGQMLSYSQIVQRIYNHSLDDGTAHQLLKTHIHNLRHKLDPTYIVNVRSTGYRLLAPEQARPSDG